MSRALLIVVFVVAIVFQARGVAQSQPEPIFSAPETSSLGRTKVAPQALSQGIEHRAIVGMKLNRLFDAERSRIRLNIDDHDWIARVDTTDDVAGHRTWVGSIEGIEHSHVSFAVRDQIVSGVVNALTESYAVGTIEPGLYTLDRVSEKGPELQPLEAPVTRALAAPKSLQSIEARDDGKFIDVLLLYTAAAQSFKGGPLQMDATVAQVISDSNEIYRRSGINTRLRLAGSAQVPFAESFSLSTDLFTLGASPAVRQMRDATGADLVQLLEISPDAPCGVGYLLTPFTDPETFPAMSVVDVRCMGQYTPTHEMGHNMGSQHDPANAATAPLCPYSYGYRDPTGVRPFRTVMAYACEGVVCPRVPYMSNPDVSYEPSGRPTGTPLQNNALSINNAAEFVANFRRAVLDLPPPTQVTGLRSQVCDGNVTLAWDAPTHVLQRSATKSAALADGTTYTVQIGASPSNYNLLTLSVASASISGAAIAPATYYWRVTASNRAGTGTPSFEDHFTVGGSNAPGAPSNFASVVGANRVVMLTWAPPSSGTGPFAYLLEAGTAPGLSDVLVAPLGATTSTSVLAPPGTYFVRLRAANACARAGGPASGERMIVVP